MTTFVLVAAAIIIMAACRDLKFNTHRCVVCGERGEHLVGCPGRRGY